MSQSDIVNGTSVRLARGTRLPENRQMSNRGRDHGVTTASNVRFARRSSMDSFFNLSDHKSLVRTIHENLEEQGWSKTCGREEENVSAQVSAV